jgi:hypothetical protein
VSRDVAVGVRERVEKEENQGEPEGDEEGVYERKFDHRYFGRGVDVCKWVVAGRLGGSCSCVGGTSPKSCGTLAKMAVCMSIKAFMEFSNSHEYIEYPVTGNGEERNRSKILRMMSWR